MDRKRELTKLRVRKYRRLKKDLEKWRSLGIQKARQLENKTNNVSSEIEEICTIENQVQNHDFNTIKDYDETIKNDEIKSDCHKDEDLNFKIQDNAIPDNEMDSNEVKAKEIEVNQEFSDLEDEESYYSYDEGDEYESSDLEDLLQNSENDEEEQLREWAIKGNISWILVSQLLLILRRRLMPNLPKTAATFFKVKEHFNIKSIKTSFYKNAEFVYFGIVKGLASCFNPSLHTDGIIYLDVNIDGASLWKSSFSEFWPILCRIHYPLDNVYAPFPVAIYLGSGKPQNLEFFLNEFIEEMNDLQKNGIELEGKLYKIRIKSWILDTPARALIKCVKGHSGYFACERCEVIGERCENRTIFADVNAAERTDKCFRDQKQSEHHKGVSPLLKLSGLNMITMFVLDFMHLGFLGIMKKLLSLWLSSANRSYRFSSSQKQKVDFMLNELKSQVPIEFQRKTETLNEISLWKATQFSFFLLYAGVVVLKKILTPQLYNHFLLLFTSCRILCSKDLAIKYNTIAKLYLKRFVLLMIELYGKSSISINVHNLLHVADDVKNMNCHLSLINSYPFESLLGKMKKSLRSGNKPMQQLCNRMHDMFFKKKQITSVSPRLIVIKQNSSEVLKIKYEQAVFTTKSPNNMVLLKNDKCFEIKKMYRDTENIDHVFIQGVEWIKQKSFFTYPTNSETLGLWKLHEKPCIKEQTTSTFNIKKKLVKLTVRLGPDEPQTVVVLPLLH